MTFKYTPKGGEGEDHIKIWGEEFFHSRNSKCKDPEVGTTHVFQGVERRLVCEQRSGKVRKVIGV